MNTLNKNMNSQIRTEQLMRNSAAKNSGWTSCVQNGCVNRIIQIGTRKNCNQDVLIKIPQIETNIRDIMSKYNITDYEVNEIEDNDEHSYQLSLKEEVYKDFVKCI